MTISRLSSLILYKWMGFSTEVTQPLPEKCIIALAPHTSNWDFIIGILYSRAEAFESHFLIKKDWFFWPMGPIMRRLGGVPVYRDKRLHTTDLIAQKAIHLPSFRVCITPEGTRKANSQWKKGFYYIALKGGMPILLYGLDYARKRIVCTRTFIPTGDVERDMQEIKQYYKTFKGKHPKRFAL